MSPVSRVAVLTTTTLLCIAIDQSSKLEAQSRLRGHASESYLDGMFNLVYAENAGTMLGIGSRLPEEVRFGLFVVVIGTLLLALASYILLKPLRFAPLSALSLIVAGGLSNLLDRLLRQGIVIDFIHLRVGTLESGIFNIADIAITAGTVILCLTYLRSKLAKLPPRD